eukprot:TRINITY_DN23796_c0_g1_i1.p1 TRINITY_DN23796_c0_g1~~TRINITY_DN23796_c0_g1_i1.p1  ORF type:complete len:328 (-),score=49.08 TRINITY_DN23796_c0_g1_i1:229-1212(-)
MPFLDARNTTRATHRLYYRLMPEGSIGDDITRRPRVLLLMGMGGTQQAWKFQADHLSSFCQVCLMDNRGIGYSEAPKGEWRWTTSRMAEDAKQVLDAVGWHTDVHIIGISLGGMIAQELALAHPDCVASITLISTTASPSHSIPSFGALMNFSKAAGVLPANAKERGLAALRVNMPERWLQENRKSDLHNGQEVSHERWVKKVNAIMAAEVPVDLKAEGEDKPPAQPPISTLRKQLSAVMTHQTTFERFESVRSRMVPVTVLTGDSDELVRPINSRVLAEMLQQPVQMLEGAGHGLIHQDPAGVNSILEATIREGERRRLVVTQARL